MTASTSEKPPYVEKLLSHRLRGFAEYENTASALLRACDSEASYLEVDTRACRDGSLFVHHDPWFSQRGSARVLLATTPDRDARALQYASGEPLLTLEHCLRTFAERSRESQKLCLDIKDHGFEDQHLALVKSAGLEHRVCWVSWIPQTLVRLHELGATGPLILAHWNILRLGAAGRALSRALGPRIARLRHFVMMGRDAWQDSLAGLSHGFQHCLVCDGLPSPLETLLRNHNGGVCVHHSLVTSDLVRDCRDRGLALWVFRVGTRKAFLRWARVPGIEVVFSDDAGATL